VATAHTNNPVAGIKMIDDGGNDEQAPDEAMYFFLNEYQSVLASKRYYPKSGRTVFDEHSLTERGFDYPAQEEIFAKIVKLYETFEFSRVQVRFSFVKVIYKEAHARMRFVYASANTAFPAHSAMFIVNRSERAASFEHIRRVLTDASMEEYEMDMEQEFVNDSTATKLYPCQLVIFAIKSK